MGATTDRLLDQLEQSTSRTTNALKDLVRANGNIIEGLENKVESLKTRFPERIYGVVIDAKMGMNGMEEAALQLSIESSVKMESTRRETGFIISQKLAGPAALRFLASNKVEDTADLKEKAVELIYDEDENRYDLSMVDSLPIGFAQSGQALFVGSRISAIGDNRELFTGTITRQRGDGEVYCETKRDDGVTGGGENGDYITYFSDIEKVL